MNKLNGAAQIQGDLFDVSPKGVTGPACLRCRRFAPLPALAVCPACRVKGLRAAVLWQPYATAVALHGKDVENRPQPPWSTLRGDLVAILAACHVDAVREAEDEAWIFEHVGVRLHTATMPRGAIVAVARVGGHDEVARSPWWSGATTWTGKPNRAWRLLDVVAIPTPVPHKGAQGFPQVTDAAALAIWTQLATVATR